MQYVQAFLSVHGAGGYTKHLKIIEYVGFDTGKAGFCRRKIVRFNGCLLYTSTYADMGIKGFKVDFMDRDDQTAIEMVERLAACTAKHLSLIHILDNFLTFCLAKKPFLY